MNLLFGASLLRRLRIFAACTVLYAIQPTASLCEPRRPSEASLLAEASAAPPDTAALARQFPAPLGPVSDYEALLDSAQQARLVAAIGAADQRCDCRMAVVTLDSARVTGTFDGYSVALFNHWGMGDKDTDNGLLISLSAGRRTVRITTGTGLDSRLTDQAAQEIVQRILPHFKAGDYAGGLERAIELAAARLAGERR